MPAVTYFVVFFIVTYPLMLDFSTHFFADERDGLVMIWNVWWTNMAVTVLHQSPWHTNYMFYPSGIDLLPHTLCSLKGFLGIPLLKILTLIQTYNLLIVFSFVVAGLTMFWLAFYVTRSYFPSLVAGFIFSFSNYHFAHMPGHLNLTSLEWIPLFVLSWYVLLKKPGMTVAIASSASLFAVLLCDYYYFVYCFLLALTVMTWRVVRERSAFSILQKTHAVPVLVFVLMTLASSGVLVVKLLRVSKSESLVGHDPSTFSTDLLSPFVYGSGLRFSNVTEGFWRSLPGNTSENSVYMGTSVLALVIYAWVKRKQIEVKSLRLWFVLLLLFLAFSLGPKLHVAGKYVSHLPMPYQLLELVFPPLELSGATGRMMVIVMMCAAIIGAMGLRLLWRRAGRTRAFAVLLVVVLFAEFLPSRLPTFRPHVPASVEILRDLSNSGGVLDGVNDPYHQLYFQTIYEKPLVGGHVARVPPRLAERLREIVALAKNHDDQTLLRKYDVHYFIVSDNGVLDFRRGKSYGSGPDP